MSKNKEIKKEPELKKEEEKFPFFLAYGKVSVSERDKMAMKIVFGKDDSILTIKEWEKKFKEKGFNIRNLEQ